MITVLAFIARQGACHETSNGKETCTCVISLFKKEERNILTNMGIYFLDNAKMFWGLTIVLSSEGLTVKTIVSLAERPYLFVTFYSNL